MVPITLQEAALLVVDAQRGFTSLCPAELPVPGGLEIVPNVNLLLDPRWRRIDASQDWHPSDHCSFFPGNSSLIATFQNELKGFETSKGTIRFPMDKPLSTKLLKKLVKARIADNERKQKR